MGPARGAKKAKRRVGRGIGSGRGKTCGAGHKGQKSRSGGGVRPGFEGGQMPLQMRLPKFGFTSRVGRTTAEVRTSALNRLEAEVVNMETLREAGLIGAGVRRVKVMLSGEVTRALTLEGIRATRGAREAIEKAGGRVVEAPPHAPKPKKKEKKKAEENRDAPAPESEAPAPEAPESAAPAPEAPEQGKAPRDGGEDGERD